MAVSGHFRGRDVVRWGIIGCGDVTEVKSGPAFQKAAGSRLVAVMRRNGALAADYARRHGVPRWYDDAEALIRDAEVDAVYVATPPDTHEHYALRVAAAGKPAYVEKPMARHAPECDRMVSAFANAGLPLFVAYYRRRLPRFLAVEELMQTGQLGTITSVSYRLAMPHHRAASGWRVDAKSSGAGHFLDVGSHALDLIDYLCGPLSDVAGHAASHGAPSGVEDAVTMSFRVGNGGVLGTAHFNFATDVKDDLLRVAGTEGEVMFSVFGNEPVRCETAAGVQFLERPNHSHVQQPLVQTVVDDLLGRGSCPSTGETARRTSRVMDQVLEKYYGGRGDAFWERAERWPGRS